MRKSTYIGIGCRMTRIIIKYKLEQVDKSTGVKTLESLATEVHDGVTEVPIPADPLLDAENEVPVYLTRRFSGYKEQKTWKVLRIESSTSTDGSVRCVIILQWLDTTLLAPSLNDIHRNGTKVNQGQINGALRFGTLVECDFGYFSDRINTACESTRLTDYYTFKLPFEMVKRRVCVVVSNYIDPCLVIPVSSKNDEYNKSSTVSLEGFPNNLYKYNNATEHYVKGTMLTSVSSHRIFPLLVQPKGRRASLDKRFSTHIKNEDDINNIKWSILNTTAIGERHKELIDENDSLIQQSEKLEISYKELERELSVQKAENESLKAENQIVQDENKVFQDLYANV